MKIGDIAVLPMIFALLSGCSSLAVRDMIATTPDIKALKEKKIAMADKINCSSHNDKLKEQQKATCHFERFFEIMTMNPGSDDNQALNALASQALQQRIQDDKQYENSIPNRLITSPVTQKMGEYVKSLLLPKQVAGNVVSFPSAYPEISARELMAFGKLLSDNSGALLRELQTAERTEKGTVEGEDETGVTRLLCNENDTYHFGNILLTYLRAYGSGSFIDRFGNNISKPTLSLSGVSDDDIQGLTTVFFEALFDCASKVPVFYIVDSKVNPLYSSSKNPNPKPGDKDDNLSVTYQRTYFKAYITNGGDIPSAITENVAKDQLALLENPDGTAGSGPGVYKNEAKKIQQIAKLAGKLSRSLTGLAFGFLNNVNVSFVIGADFAVGDNKTLMHLAQTLAETWSRRVAEYAAWEVFSKN